jgi:hypothetical protein
MTTSESNILLKRFTLIKKMEYLIDESVYYRTHSDSFSHPKYNLYKFDADNR